MININAFKLLEKITYIGVLSLFLVTENIFASEVAKTTSKKSESNKEVQELNKQKVDGLITSNWGDYFNITRLQTRTSDNGRQSINQSTFIRLPSKIFIAESFDHTESYKDNPSINFFEMFLGGPIGLAINNKALEWVTRVQAVHAGVNIKPEYSAGLQYNIDKLDLLESFFKERKITTFVQIFPVRSNDELGKYDVLHYFSVPIYKKFYVRGYNRWFHFDNRKDYFLSFQDFILPINSKFDTYIRHTYQSRNDFMYGVRGSDMSFGIRMNHSF